MALLRDTLAAEYDKVAYTKIGYDILYKENPVDYYSKGIFIESKDPFEALEKFKDAFPYDLFIGMNYKEIRIS